MATFHFPETFSILSFITLIYSTCLAIYKQSIIDDEKDEAV